MWPPVFIIYGTTRQNNFRQFCRAIHCRRYPLNFLSSSILNTMLEASLCFQIKSTCLKELRRLLKSLNRDTVPLFLLAKFICQLDLFDELGLLKFGTVKLLCRETNSDFVTLWVLQTKDQFTLGVLRTKWNQLLVEEEHDNTALLSDVQLRWWRRQIRTVKKKLCNVLFLLFLFVCFFSF